MKGHWIPFARPISVRFTTHDGQRIPGYVIAWTKQYTNPRDAFAEPEIEYIIYLMDDGKEIASPKIIEWYA